MVQIRKKNKKAQGMNIMGTVLGLIVTMAIATLLTVLTGTLSGKAYDLTEDDIDEISNVTIKGHVMDSIIAGFEAQETTASYLSLIALGVVIFIVITLVLSFTAFTGGLGRGGGSPL